MSATPLVSGGRGQDALRSNELGAYFDGLADRWEAFRARNPYYHRTLRTLFCAFVPPGLSVLELGCATGELLAAVRPARGLGVDLSARMVENARRRHPELEFVQDDCLRFETQERFDCILLHNLLEYIDDLEELLRRCRQLLQPRGRILISTLNPLWSPVLRAGAKLGLSTPDTRRNFVTAVDTANLLRLNGFQVVRMTRRMLLPKRIPLLSALVNVVAAQAPVLRRMSIAEFLVARPLGEGRERSVSVVVPCHNEAGNIEECIRRIPPMGLHTEVIVVDDGSEDGTAQRARPELNPAVTVRSISYQPNRGKLHAMRAGFEAASGDVLMVLDADMAMPPEDLRSFYRPLRDGLADFVNGTRLIYPRTKSAMNLAHFAGNKLFGILMSWLTDIHLSDTLCGTKAFFREDYRNFVLGSDPWGDFDLLFGAAQNACRILEVPIHYQERRAGRSKMKAFRHALVLLRACWQGFWRVKYPRCS